MSPKTRLKIHRKNIETSSDVKIHHKLHNLDSEKNKFKCVFCPKIFTFKSEFDKHSLVHSNEGQFSCHICMKLFKREWDCKRHIKIVHVTKERVHKCIFHRCRSAFKTLRERKIHLISHFGQRSLQCTHVECGKTFDSKQRLTTHLRVHDNYSTTHCKRCWLLLKGPSCPCTETTFQCQLCHKVYPDQTGLRYHIRSHTNERPYQCTLCPRAFVTSSQLQQHMQSLLHLDEKLHKCSKCTKSFGRKSNLNRHFRSAHGGSEVMISCRICDKPFGARTLSRHIRLMHGDKEHRCYFCDKMYSCPETLFDHLRVQHVFERPFKCSICGKEFVRSGYLRGHMVTHASGSEKATD